MVINFTSCMHIGCRNVVMDIASVLGNLAKHEHENRCHFLYVVDCAISLEGAQWLSGRVLDSKPRGRRVEPHRRHCVVSLSKNINPSNPGRPVPL